jgi:hypothetical protein
MFQKTTKTATNAGEKTPANVPKKPPKRCDLACAKAEQSRA